MGFLLILLKMVLGVVFLGFATSICYILVSATIYAVNKAIKEKNDESEDI